MSTFGAYLLPLMCRLESQFPGIKIVNYADDLVLAGEDGHMIQNAVDMVADYASKTGLKINPRKSSYWLHGKACDELPATVQVQGEQLIPQENVEVLGAQMATDKGVQIGAAAKMESRHQEANRRCRVLQATPTSWRQRARAVGIKCAALCRLCRMGSQEQHEPSAGTKTLGGAEHLWSHGARTQSSGDTLGCIRACPYGGPQVVLPLETLAIVVPEVRI